MWVYVGAYYLICTSRDLFSILKSAAERWVASIEEWGKDVWGGGHSYEEGSVPVESGVLHKQTQKVKCM